MKTSPLIQQTSDIQNNRLCCADISRTWIQERQSSREILHRVSCLPSWTHRIRQQDSDTAELRHLDTKSLQWKDNWCIWDSNFIINPHLLSYRTLISGYIYGLFRVFALSTYRERSRMFRYIERWVVFPLCLPLALPGTQEALAVESKGVLQMCFPGKYLRRCGFGVDWCDFLGHVELIRL